MGQNLRQWLISVRVDHLADEHHAIWLSFLLPSTATKIGPRYRFRFAETFGASEPMKSPMDLLRRSFVRWELPLLFPLHRRMHVVFRVA